MADILINGSGILNRRRWADIPGLHSFKGTLVHGAAWDTDLDWTRKRVAHRQWLICYPNTSTDATYSQAHYDLYPQPNVGLFQPSGDKAGIGQRTEFYLHRG